MIIVFLLLSIFLIIVNKAKKSKTISDINIFSSIAIPTVIYLLNWIIINIKAAEHYDKIDFSGDISSYIIFFTLVMEVGIIFYFYKSRRNELSPSCVLGFIITTLICDFMVFISTSPDGRVYNEKGFSVEELYNYYKETIFISMIFSIFAINIFTLLSFNEKTGIDSIKDDDMD